MQVKELINEGLRREFDIVIAASALDDALMERLKQIAPQVRIQGFRPGKAPLALLKKRYGPSVMGEVLERVIGQTSQQALQERSLRAAEQPRIEITQYDEGGDLHYKMALELLPEIQLVDPSTLTLERMTVEVGEAEVTEVLEKMAERNKRSEAIKDNRAAVAGDVVVIDFLGKIDGVEFPGGKAERYELELGSGSFIPGFEDQVIGLSPGQSTVVKVKFPDDYGADNLKGRDATFDVTLHEIRELVPGRVDDELATRVGVRDLEALRKRIHDGRVREYYQVARQRLKRKLFDKLAEVHDFELPLGVVETELESIWASFEDVRKNDPDSLDEEERNKTDDELRADYRTLAERRVKLALLLSEFGQTNKIEITAVEVEHAIRREASRYPGQEQAVRDFYDKNQQAREGLIGPLYEDKVVDFILELVKVTDHPVTAEELMRDDDDESEASSAGKPAVKKPAAKKPAAKKPATPKAATQKTATKKAPAKTAASKAATTEKPAAKKPAAKKPAAKKPAAKKPAAKKPAAKKPAAKKPAAKKPAAKKTVAKK